MKQLKVIGGLNVLFQNNLLGLTPEEAVNYINRVLADGGTIDLTNDELYDFIKWYRDNGLLLNTKLLAAPFLGSKIRQSTIYKYISKLYSVQLAANDLAQTTELNQPYQAGNIAPNEVLSMSNPNGDARYLTHPAISFVANEAWTYVKVLNTNGTSSATHPIYSDVSGNSKILIKNTTNIFALINASNTTVSGTVTNYGYIGKSTIVHFVADGAGSLKIYVNGVLFDTLTVATNFVFEKIEGSVFDYFDRVQAGAITAAQALLESNKLRSYVPEVETILIGTKYIISSNCQMVSTPAGNPIPEVQLAATWATAEDTYNTTYAATSGTADEKRYAALKAAAMWCSYDNSTANQAVYGKLYNDYAVQLLKTDMLAQSYGYHIPTEAELTAILAAYPDANTLKVGGTNYWDNDLGTNTSGLTLLGTGCRMSDGSFASTKKVGGFATSDGNTFKQLGMPIRLIRD